MSSVPDSIRINKYRSLYMGKERRDPYLNDKRKTDRAMYDGILAPPILGHFTSVQRSHPKNYDIDVQRHQKPLHVVPDERGATRYIRGSSQYNQAVQQKIGELAKLAGKSSY